jgi:hypothetical protein
MLKSQIPNRIQIQQGPLPNPSGLLQGKNTTLQTQTIPANQFSFLSLQEPSGEMIFDTSQGNMFIDPIDQTRLNINNNTVFGSYVWTSLHINVFSNSQFSGINAAIEYSYNSNQVLLNAFIPDSAYYQNLDFWATHICLTAVIPIINTANPFMRVRIQNGSNQDVFVQPNPDSILSTLYVSEPGP